MLFSSLMCGTDKSWIIALVNASLKEKTKKKSLRSRASSSQWMEVHAHFFTATEHSNGREKSTFWYRHLLSPHNLPIPCEKHLEGLKHHRINADPGI